jgi:alkanesulfonate monooxygenase SsuD/methylene tetrahydromethanopterin reductase-like flavin-dependent oxidoreductase (luciferase family)
MGVECMDIVMKAWTQETVTYEGEYWSFDEALPKPKPFQQPYPPVWIGAHSTTSFDYAAKHGFHVAQNIDVDSVAAEKFAYFRQKWQEEGNTGPEPHMMLARHVHVAETDAQARAEAEPNMLQGFFGRRGSQMIASTRIGFGGDPRGTGGERTPDIDERGRVFQEMAKSYDFWIDNGLAIVGSPDTVIRKLEDQQRRVGYNVFCAQHQIGDMPREQVWKSMQLLGEKVMPAFA